jgi:flagellar FliL protein
MKKHFIILAAVSFGLVLMSSQGNVQAQEKEVEEEKITEEAKPNKKLLAKKNQKDLMFQLEPIIVNLAKSQGNRFLKVTLSLEMSASEVRPDIKKNIQKITDSILLLLSSKLFEDVYSIQGKFTLKNEITARVNPFLVLGKVKEVYFTEFIIQ